jgi:two-component system, chemotaxis family, response regulator Rcp1
MNGNPCSQRRFNVLLVEDNEDDVLLTRYTFKRMPFAVDFQIACNGLEALHLLRKLPLDDAPLPDVILLDLNMPRMDGRQLLAELKSDDRLQSIPAIVLSTSAAEEDVSNAYRRQASAYMTKPIALEEFMEAMRRFAEFWLSGVAVVPPQHGRCAGVAGAAPR